MQTGRLVVHARSSRFGCIIYTDVMPVCVFSAIGGQTASSRQPNWTANSFPLGSSLHTCKQYYVGTFIYAKYTLTFSLLALQIRLLFLSRFAYGWSIGYFTPSLFERLHPKIFSLLYFLLVFSRFSDDGFLWGGSHSSLCRQSHKQITLFF
jgi:hypothetical protein